MRKTNKLKWLGIAMFFSSGMYAQTSYQIALDSVEVSATRIITPLRETGKSVTVITEKEIAAMPVNSLDELLRFLPGININSRNAFGVQTDIGMRGSTFSQVLVLLDNQRINDPLTGHFNNNFPVPLSEISSVEIIRGPASASYGADAVGGVLHIKTKTYMAKQEKTSGLATTGEIAAGENNLFMTDAGANIYDEHWMISAGVKANIADGQEFINPNFAQETSEDSTYQNYFDLKTYTMAASYRPNEYWRIYGRISADRRDFNAKYFYTLSSYDESVEEVESLWSQLAVTHQKNKHHTELNMAYKKTEDLFIFNPSFTANEHTTWLGNANLNHHVKFSPKNSLALGLQGGTRQIESTDRGDHQVNNLGIYGVWQFKPVKRLTSNISLRAEQDDNFGTELIPQLSVAYDLDRLTLRSSLGRAIRAGDFTERYVSRGLPTLSPGRNLGNPGLKAENSYTADLGADWKITDNTLVSVTGFYRTSDNLIDYVRTNADDIPDNSTLTPGEYYFYATNIAESNTSGLESQVEKLFTLGKLGMLKLSMAYTYLETTTPDSVVSTYIANHPKHSLAFAVSLLTTHIDITGITNYVERNEKVGDEVFDAAIRKNYSVTHLKVTLKPNSQNAYLFLKVHNLFNESYQEILGAQLPFRWIMGGFGWRIM